MDYSELIKRKEELMANRFTDGQRQRMAETVNSNLKGSEFAPVVGTLRPDDFYEVDCGKFVWQKSTFLDWRDTLLNAFSSTARDRRQEQVRFYHFLKYCYALRSVEKKALQFTAMKYFKNNDQAEYSEFLRRCGYPKDGIDDAKRKLFVLCLTSKSEIERFWDEYADRDKGVCLCLRLSRFNVNTSEYWDLRDVVYDDGQRFSFIRSIRDAFCREFDRGLIIDGVDKFARFYKRQMYDWETETRITFDYRLHKCLVNVFPIKEMKNAQGQVIREFIVVPFENQFYTLTLDEIICGSNVSDQEMEDLRVVSGLQKGQVKPRP